MPPRARLFVIPAVMVAIGVCAAGCTSSEAGQAPLGPTQTRTSTVPTLSPVIPAPEFPDRLQTLLEKNYRSSAVASCVKGALLGNLSSGALSDVDVDNYLRNIVTDGMRKALVDIQNSGVCSGVRTGT